MKKTVDRCTDVSIVWGGGGHFVEELECQENAIGDCPKCGASMCQIHIDEHVKGDFCEEQS